MKFVDHSLPNSSRPEREVTGSHATEASSDSPLLLLIYSLIRYRWVVVLMALAGALAGFLQGAIQPNTYRATGQLLFRPGFREASTAESTLTGIDSRSGSARTSLGAALGTELNILGSRQLRERVVQRVGASRILNVPDPRVADYEEQGWSATALHEFQYWWWNVRASSGSEAAGEGDPIDSSAGQPTEEETPFADEGSQGRGDTVLDRPTEFAGTKPELGTPGAMGGPTAIQGGEPSAATALRDSPGSAMEGQSSADQNTEVNEPDVEGVTSTPSAPVDDDSDEIQMLAGDSGADQNAIVFLEQALQIRGSTSAGTILVQATGFDPATTIQVVTAFLEEAESFHREFYSTNSFFELLKVKEESAIQARDDAVEDLAEFRQSIEVTDLVAEVRALEADVRSLEEAQFSQFQLIRQYKRTIEFIELRLSERSAPDELPGSAATESGTAADGSEEEAVPLLSPNPEYGRVEAALFQLRLRAMDLQRLTNETELSFQERRRLLNDLLEENERRLSEIDQYLVATPVRTSATTVMRPSGVIVPVADPMTVRLLELEESLVGVNAVHGEIGDRLASKVDRLRVLRAAEQEYSRLLSEADSTSEEATDTTEKRKQLGLVGQLDDQAMGNLRILQDAVSDRFKVGPRRPRSMSLGLILGLGFGSALAVVCSLFSSRVQRPSVVPLLTDVPTLAVIPFTRKWQRVMIDYFARGKRPSAELANQIDAGWSVIAPLGWKGNSGSGATVVALTGVGGQMGVTSLALTSALGLATHARRKTLLIETSFGVDPMSDVISMTGASGLAEALAGEVPLKEVVLTSRSENLDIIIAGHSGKGVEGAFAGPEWEALLASARKTYEFVLIDTAPIISESDSRVLFWSVDAAILVVDPKVSKVHDVERATKAIRETETALLGCFVNKYRSVSPRWLPIPDPQLKAR